MHRERNHDGTVFSGSDVDIRRKVGERMEEDMDGSMLDQYMGKECTISLFNEVGAIKGKLMDADIQWVKVDTKKGTQLINRNMVRNITFDNK